MTATSRTLEHVGEWKIELRATSVGELFVELAHVIADAIGPRTPSDTSDTWEHVELEARDVTTLLVDWANELIGRSEAAERAYETVRNLRVESSPDGSVRVAADVRGASVDAWLSPVKAATYHGAVVEQEGSEWRAVALLDV